jgi:hypothetical protein
LAEGEDNRLARGKPRAVENVRAGLSIMRPSWRYFGKFKREASRDQPEAPFSCLGRTHELNWQLGKLDQFDKLEFRDFAPGFDVVDLLAQYLLSGRSQG